MPLAGRLARLTQLVAHLVRLARVHKVHVGEDIIRDAANLPEEVCLGLVRVLQRRAHHREVGPPGDVVEDAAWRVALAAHDLELLRPGEVNVRRQGLRTVGEGARRHHRDLLHGRDVVPDRHSVDRVGVVLDLRRLPRDLVLGELADELPDVAVGATVLAVLQEDELKRLRIRLVAQWANIQPGSPRSRVRLYLDI